MLPKPELYAQMRPSPTTSLKDRVYACGQLHTAGFLSELAVKLIKGRLYPLTASDIRKKLIEATEETLVSGGNELTPILKEQIRSVIGKSNVRRALAQLEKEGRALRCLRSSGKLLRDVSKEEKLGLQEGEILLFFPFRPAQPSPDWVYGKCLPVYALSSPKKTKEGRRLSTALRPIFAKLQLLRITEIDPAEVVSCEPLRHELEGAVQDYQNDQRVVLERAQNRVRVVAQSVLKERDIERVPERVEEEGISSSSSGFINKTTTTNQPPTSGSHQPKNEQNPSIEEEDDRGLVAQAMEKIRKRMEVWGTVDDDVLSEFIASCQANAPDCTVDEIVYFIAEKEKLITRGVRNPIRFLATAVPKCFQPECLRSYREKVAQRAQQEKEWQSTIDPMIEVEERVAPLFPAASNAGEAEPLPPSAEHLDRLRNNIAVIEAWIADNAGGNEIGLRMASRDLKKAESDLAAALRKPVESERRGTGAMKAGTQES